MNSLQKSSALIVLACAVATVPTLANAQVANWGGTYGGLSVGWGGTGGTLYDREFNYYSQVENGAELGSSIFLGANVGHNWQNGNLVYSVEGDIKGFNGMAARALGPNCNNYNLGISAAVATSLVGRVGYTFGDTMVYGLAGYTGAMFKNHHWDCGDRDGDMRWFNGWTAGVGGEMKLSGNASLKLEGRFSGFERVDWTDPSEEDFGAKPILGTISIGINFRF